LDDLIDERWKDVLWKVKRREKIFFSGSTQNTVKKQFFLLKVHNKLGKVTKFRTSRPLFNGGIAI